VDTQDHSASASRFWSKLEKKFRALARQLARESARESARWTSTLDKNQPATKKEWTLFATVEFKVLARRGGIKIDPSVDPLDAWLDALLEFVNNERPEDIGPSGRWAADIPDWDITCGTGTKLNANGEVVKYQFGTISLLHGLRGPLLSALSGKLCKYLEAPAPKAERGASQDAQKLAQVAVQVGSGTVASPAQLGIGDEKINQFRASGGTIDNLNTYVTGDGSVVRFVHRYHPLEPPKYLSEQDAAKLGPEWSQKYIDQNFPKWKHHWTQGGKIVNNAEEEAALGGGWADTATAFEPYRRRWPRSEQQDPTRWVDTLQIAGLSSAVKDKMKAPLRRADATFWNAPDSEGADRIAMKAAFAGVAKLLFGAGLLTTDILQKDLPIMVWEAAIAAGWYRFAAESPSTIFPEKIGRYHVWCDPNGDWSNLFHVETQEWLARLMEHSTSSQQEERQNGGAALKDTNESRQSPTPQTKPSQQRRKPIKKDYPLLEVKILARQLKGEGSSHRDVCKRLGDQPRPGGAAWSQYSWPEAYRLHREAVDKWLSHHCKP